TEIARLSDTQAAQQLTPSDYLYKKLSIDKLAELQAKYDIENIYPLSPMQQGLFYHTLLDPTSTAYYSQTAYRIKGKLEPENVEASLNFLFKRYDVFRGIFLHRDLVEPIQVILKERKVDFAFKDFRVFATQQQKEQALDKFKHDDRKKLIDLGRDTLVRIAIIQLNDEEFELIWNDHHILKDGWSAGVMMSEFLQTYYSLIQQKEPKLAPAKPYSHYLQWLEKHPVTESQNYWRQYLGDYETPAGISLLKKYNATAGYLKKEKTVVLSEDKTQQLEQLARQLNVTLNTLVQTVWGIVLARYNGCTDLVFGNVVSGRPAEIHGVEAMVGLFINTIPVRVKFENNESFADVARAMQVAGGSSAPHHYLSLAEIQSGSPLKKNLIDHVLIFDNYPIASKIEGVENNSKHIDNIPRVKGLSINDHAHYDFSIVLGPGKSFSIKFDYNALAFDDLVIDNLERALLTVLDQVIEQPATPVEDISLIAYAEISDLYNRVNPAEMPNNAVSFMELWQRQVTAVPGQPALTFGTKIYTYAELDRIVNSLAFQLKATNNIQPGDFIGLMLEPSDWVIVSMLGIMKLGACFVPIDIDLPADRKKYITNDAGLKLLILNSEHLFDVGEEEIGCDLFAIDIQFDNTVVPDKSIHALTHGDSLAYAIYTSGTTGKPKGVTIRQKSLANYVLWLQSVTGLGPVDSGLLLTSHVFDLGFTTIFGCLGSGANLHLHQESVGKNPEAILRYLHDQQITFIKATPSIFYMISHLPLFQAASIDLRLRWIFLGGEKIKAKDILGFKGRYPHTRFVNHYGPTEATIGVIAHVIDNIEEFHHEPVIGKPIRNAQAFILDEKSRPVPVGAVGEICISGAGLAKGYLNQTKLTEEKFIAHPFQPGAKIYKTGDLGKLLPSGDIAIIGRRDGQLKVNGYRVETDEIVKCLIACDQVRDAVLRVVQNGNGENELVAYCAAQSEDEALIRKHLSKNLPAYMVPATLIYIEKIPVTANGKLNVKELPDLNQALRGTTLLKMPETPLQEKLVSIWKEVLQRNEVGITDNFFALGGDSIKAVRLVGSINTSLDQWVEVKDVFEYQDIEALSRFLESDRQLMERQKQMEEASIHLQEFKQDIVNQRALRKALPESYEDFFPMSDIQMGMLYHGFISPAEGVYHQEKFSQFRDSTFDPSVFEQAIKLMVHKHPILRTTFDLSNFDLPIQIVHKPLACVLPVTLEDLSDKPHEDIIAYLNTVKKKDLEKPFRDGKEFLWRLYAFKLSKDEYGLLFTYHHAILDGWSEASFYAELSHCYFELKNDRSYRPGVLKADYRDYVQAQWVAKKDERAKEFWQRTLEGYERTHLPFQKQLDKLTSRKQSVSRPFLLGEETVSKLDRLAALHHMHIKEIFLAAYLYLLKVTTGKNDVTIGLVTNSRPDKPDGDKVLGCFLNTIPFRYQFGAQMTVRQFIDHIAERINELRYYDRYPLPDILRAIGEETGNYNPIYDNRFDYVDFYIDKTTHHDADIARPVVSGRGNSDHRFSLNIRRSGEELAVRFFYIEDLYKAEEVERLEAYFKLTLDLLLGDEEKLLTSNAILPEKEIQVLLSAETPAKYPDKELIHTLFEKSAIQFPDNIAVVSEGRSLTYRQLNERANQIGHYLQKEKGVGAGELVGVLAGRNEMMPVMILGILKAGAGYVPIDPDHPQERNISLLDDASIKIVLCDQPSAMPSGLPVELVNVCAVNLDQYPVTDLKVINKPSDIAYIIFTSGSTGKPKGVVVEHENVVRLLFNNAFQFSFSERDTWTLFHSICFDFSVWEMYGALLYGGRLVMVPKQTAISPAEFVDLLIKEQVTVLNQVPAMFDNVVAEIKTRGLKRSDLRYIIFGGAALKPQNLAWWISNFPEMKLVNMYGITETTVHVTYKEVTVDMVREGSSNIGTPIPTLKTLLMDQDLGLVPANVPGEIVVSGKGVARGYLNRPELTSERFRTNPYDKDERIYLSGDLGYRNKEGELIYLGRKDSQIKLRGFRIEIGEIENAILKYPDVQNTVVLLSEGTKEVEKQLIAFILSQKELDSDSLRNFLATRLPDYMVPAQFVGLKKFPLTINKKIDFKALLKLQGNRLSTGVEYVEPQNALQAKLITIWRDELKTERVGIHDNFFALGGDSLKAIRLVAKMNAEASLSCKIADLFKHPTIAELTASSEVLHGENSLEHERIIGHGRISEFKDRILSDASQKEKLPADWV
ncbi:MAG: amino acid adenylation domain-containing protein, partial [Bacteroidota bacterium]